MGSLFGRSKVRLLLIVMLFAVALVAFNSGPGLATVVPVAHAAQLNACTDYHVYNGVPGFWDAQYESRGQTSCLGYPPLARGWIYACSGVYVTVNMDVWITPNLVRGGTRLAESGRTGLKTWAPDCSNHEQVSVTGWGLTTVTPLWACMWAYDQTVNLAFNYLCAQDY